jgi:HEAT repeat protein
MKKNTLILGVVFCALAAICPGYAQDLDQSIGALKAYKFGDSRTGIVPLEELALKAQNDGPLRVKLEEQFIEVLKSDASVEAKRFVCRQLGAMGTAKSVDTLAGLIADEQLADYALRALVSIPDKASLAALVKAIVEGPQTQKVNIVNAIARTKSPDAVAPLVALMGDTDQALAQAATAALGSIGGKGCTELLKALKAANGGGDTVLADACLQCGQWAPASKKDEALDIYTTLYGGAQPGYVRAAALTGLVRLEPAKAQELVMDALGDSDPALVLVASSFIRELPGEEATKAFAGMLPNADKERKILIIDALAHRKEAGALDAVVAEAKGSDPAVQLIALNALGVLGTPDTAAMLLELAATSDGDVQRTARNSIKTIPGRKTDVAILKAAQEGTGAVRLEAISALAARGAVKTTPALLELANSGDAAVETEALKALRVLAGEDDMGTLISLLTSASADDKRKNVAQAIVELSGRIADDGAKSAQPIKALATASDDATKASIIMMLGRIGTEDALTVVRDNVKSQTPALKLAAVQALADWPSAAPMDDLKALATDMSNAETHGAAFAGYVRLLRADKTLNPADKLAALKAADALASTPQEKKLIVAGTAEVVSLEALQYAESRQQDPAVAAEATQAVIRIAGAIGGAYRDEVTTRMNTYLQQDTNEAVKKLAQNVLNGLVGYEDYITAWQYAGPYFVEGKPGAALYDMQFKAETEPAGEVWNIVPMGLDPLRPWVVALAQILGDFDRVVYLRSTITSATAQDVILETGSNDGIKVWWNGEMIHGLNVARGLAAGQDQLPVSLKAGENTLVMAIYQHGGDWGAAARLRTKDGQPVTGITQAAK